MLARTYYIAQEREGYQQLPITELQRQALLAGTVQRLRDMQLQAAAAGTEGQQQASAAAPASAATSNEPHLRWSRAFCISSHLMP